MRRLSRWKFTSWVFSVVPESVKYASREPAELDQPFAVQVAAGELVNHALHVQDAPRCGRFRLRTPATEYADFGAVARAPCPTRRRRRGRRSRFAATMMSSHGGFFEIQNADPGICWWRCGIIAPRFSHDGAQLLAAQGVRDLLLREAEQTQHAVREQIRRPHEGIEQGQQRRVDIGRGQREAFPDAMRRRSLARPRRESS